MKKDILEDVKAVNKEQRETMEEKIMDCISGDNLSYQAERIRTILEEIYQKGYNAGRAEEKEKMISVLEELIVFLKDKELTLSTLSSESEGKEK